MDTTVYFIRHSVRFKNTELIESYRTDQSELLKKRKNNIKCNRREKIRNIKQRRWASKYGCRLYKQLCKNITDC